MNYETGIGGRKYAITTESPFDKVVKWLSVYFIGFLGLFLLVKEHVFGKFDFPFSLTSTINM
jgi:hypothetical protein